MGECYRCWDGREALLLFDEDALTVRVATPAGEEIGRYEFAHVLPTGELANRREGRDAPARIKLRNARLAEPWYGQGIEERILLLVAEKSGPRAPDHPPR